MKKIEDIPKTNLFEIPNGYFERLPLEIMTRIERKQQETKPQLIYILALRYALPVLIFITVAFFLFRNTQTTTFTSNQLLSQISSDELVNYLDEIEITNDDFLNSIDLEQINSDSLNNQTMNLNLNEKDVEELSNEYL